MRRALTLGAVAFGWLLALAGSTSLLWGQEVQTYRYSYGQPAIEALPGPLWPYELRYPSIAARGFQLYVGGRQINVFCYQGVWADFWPFSSLAGGIPGVERDDSWAADIAPGPGGLFYVLDSTYAAVHAYQNDGQLLRAWGGVDEEPGRLYRPRAIAASPDWSVYVLDISPYRIVRFSATGELLNQWQTPAGAEGETIIAWDIAPAADRGVWLLAEIRVESEGGSELRDVHVYRYDPTGELEEDWSVAGASGHLRLGVDSEGYVWVLDSAGVWGLGARLQRFTPWGTRLAEIALYPRDVLDFCVSEDRHVSLVRPESVSGWPHDYRAVTCWVETTDFEGNRLYGFGWFYMLANENRLMAPAALAATPSGESYVKVHRPEAQYVVHYRDDGELVEAFRTEKWPIYSPFSGRVELLPTGGNYIGPDGQVCSYCVCSVRSTLQAGPGGETECVVEVDVGRWAEGSTSLPFTLRLTNPPPAGFWEGLTYGYGVLGQRPDGSLLLAVRVCSCLEGGGREILWVVTLTTSGEFLDSWFSWDPDWGCWPTSLTTDSEGSVYVGGYGVWKFSATGALLGRMGAWGGTAGLGEGPGSLVLQARALHVDALGRLRVLDYEANRVLVFTYEDGPFADVPHVHWARAAVEAVAQAGIASGYPDGLYHPEAPVTRDQAAVYVARGLAGGDGRVPEGPAIASFPDVPTSHWAYRYVEHLRVKGVVSGYGDRLYHPEDIVDRGQMAAFAARALAGGETDIPQLPLGPPAFGDVNPLVNSWCYRYVEYLAKRGLIKGYPDGLYHPDHACSRDQVAVFVARVFELPM